MEDHVAEVRLWRKVTEHPIPSVLAGTAAVSLTLLAVLLLTVPTDQRNELLVEIGKGLTQLVVVVLLGTALKLLGDRYQAQQQKAEQDRATREVKEEQDRGFRQDKYDRLVRATNQLRRVPILIEADRSVKTWNEQMLAVVDVSLDLRMIKHQIYSSQGAQHPPFDRIDELTYLFELMYHYTDWVTADIGDHRKELGNLRKGAGIAVSEEARAQLRATLWNQIRALPSVADMLATERDDQSLDDNIQAEVRAMRAGIRESIDTDMMADPGTRVASLDRWRTRLSWLVYQEAESLALASIASQE